MRRHGFMKVAVLLVLVLALTIVMQTANAAVERVTSWYWIGDTEVYSVVRGDVDSDGNVEIVTGGYFNDGVRDWAQLVIWNGATLQLAKVAAWHWNGNTQIYSVALGDVDADGKVEIVTGGRYYDGNRWVAQLCVWYYNGATMVLEGVRTWFWTSHTGVWSVAIGDVDGDAQVEIVTGGYFNDGVRDWAQLVIWNGANLALDKPPQVWFWTDDTIIRSVAVGNVDGDAQVEIVTGGWYNDGSSIHAQLCVWNGATLALESVKTWWMGGPTYIYSVCISDVDADSNIEIVTGGFYNNGAIDVAQLYVHMGATLAPENIKTWYMSGSTKICSVAAGDLDADGKVDIVTGGDYNDGTRHIAQLCVWNGATLALEDSVPWYWVSHTYIWSVAVGNVDGDNNVEITTGGFYFDLARYVAQLCVWP